MVFAPSNRSFEFIAAALVLTVTHQLFGFTSTGNVYTTNGSQSDVSAAIASAPAGSFINIPAGTFTWGAGGTSVVINSAITLVGAGTTNTIINLDPTGPTGTNGTIQINAAAVVKGFTINSAPNVAIFTVGSANGWRITTINYPNLASDTAYFCVINGGYGLIDSCNITGGGGTNELIFVRGPNNSWQTPDSLGTANNVFVEDCTFNGPGYVSDANANARFVVRFCTINGVMKIDGHGFASNTPPRSVREMEIYNNQWTNNSQGYFALEWRGGTGVLFNNVVPTSGFYLNQYWEDYGYQGLYPNYAINISSVSAGNPATVTTTTPHGLKNGIVTGFIQVTCGNSTPALSGFYTVTVTGPNTFTIPVSVISAGNSGSVLYEPTPYNYPLQDQVGVGMDGVGGPYTGGGGSDPMYSWHNLQGGSNWVRATKTPDVGALAIYLAETGLTSFNDSNVIETDRDVFTDLTVTNSFNGTTGVGIGTTAQMNSITPTKTGVGFWVTDQGQWNTLAGGNNGQLYAWNGTSWALKYTPYTYPNPMRAPIAPSNLSISSP